MTDTAALVQSLIERVELLEDKLAIQELITAYGPAVDAGDAPVTAVDWQVTSIGRGAYDIAYFLSQSLSTDTRRGCEADLIERYQQRLAEHGIDYPTGELLRDYRLTTAWCFSYPVIGAGRIDIANERQRQLLQTMLNGAATAIEDHDALALRPD